MRNRINITFYKNAGRYFSGEMSKEESEQFQAYYYNSKVLSEELKKIQKIWDTSAKIKRPENINMEKALMKTKQKRVYGLKGNSKLVFYLEKAAAFLFIPLLVASLIYYISNKQIREQKSVYHEVDNAYGTVSRLTLPDGTHVWLNSGSHFKYPLFFSQGIRKVYLSGEAYFEVAKNKKKPFVVNTTDIDIMATGTVFSVMAYTSDANIEATLANGKICLAKEVGPSHKLKTVVSVKPGQKVILNKEKKKIHLEKTDCEKVFAWKNGKLIFRDDPMDVVVKKLNRWYNTDIVLVDKDLKSFNYTATFTDETLLQVMELLKYSAPITYKYYSRKKLQDQTFSKARVEIRLNQNMKSKNIK